MKITRLTGWTIAMLLALGVHGATALWVMQVRPDLPEPPGQPIFVDLAPPPPGADFSAPEAGEAQPSPVEDLPEPEPEPARPEEIAEPDPDLPVIDELPEVQHAEAVLASSRRPEQRPKVQPKQLARPVQEKTEKPAEVKERQKPQPRKTASSENRASRSTATNQAAAEASGNSTGAGVKAEADWRAAASAAVARHMHRGRYTVSSPVAATIRLSVDGSGRITTASVSSGAGGAVDAALSRQINRLSKLPAPPGGRPVSASVSVQITR